jgi:hypothetical protein
MVNLSHPPESYGLSVTLLPDTSFVPAKAPL